MISHDIPEVLFATHAGDMVWVPYSGPALKEILRLVRRKDWEYTAEPHGFGSLLHCTRSPLGGEHEIPRPDRQL